MAGTISLKTPRLSLRRHVAEDAGLLYRNFGTDAAMVRYSGWNPYATPEQVLETVQRFIDGYGNDFGRAGHTYSWVLDVDDVIVGTVGAYGYTEDPKVGGVESYIEVGLSIVQGWWGRGFATEALACVLHHLTENEGIDRVIAWCASENIGSKKAMEKAGMRCIAEEPGGLVVGDKQYDKLTYEYRRL